MIKFQLRKDVFMSKSRISFVSLLLVLGMLFGVLASCDSSEFISTEGTTDLATESTEETTQAQESESDSDTVKGSETEADTKAETEADTKAETDSETEEDTTPRIEGEHAALIEYADRLANKVQSYRPDIAREYFIMENSEMTMEYALNNAAKQQVVSLTDKQGNAYLENTMDVFMKMKNGKTYYASNSFIDASANIYRLGYYYYENRIANQMFIGDDYEVKELNIDAYRIASSHNVKLLDKTKEAVRFEITDVSDPWFSLSKAKFDADDYKYLRITMKCGSGIGAGSQVFLIAGSSSGYTAKQSIDFTISADGQYHTYTIPLYTVSDYTGQVRGIRIDINGTAGSVFEIAEIKAVSLGDDAPEAVGLNRSFLTYSDKMHHIIQVATKETFGDVEAIGMITNIPEEKVEKLVVKDKDGLKYAIEGVDWDSAEYVGFDIKNAGIFGYILPFDNKSGTLSVTLADGVYTIVQIKSPEGGTLYPSDLNTRNANDFYMGQRVYTDGNHSFDEFLYEAECERNPLTNQNFVVDTRSFSGSRYVGYDPLYGYYEFSVPIAGGFNGPFFQYPNRQFGVNFTVKGDDLDRRIYVNAATTDGALECSAILDGKNMMLPIPLEVSKNFKGDGEANLYNLDDATYGNVYLPLVVDAGSKEEYTILHLYQNWGGFPLKQISSIQYFSPYYHLSTGVTETNCVVPFGSSGLSLPDFRSMSAPFWKSQPQHNSCGTHNLLQYTTAEGELISNQMESVRIDSYGPTYADMSVDFITDDKNMKMTYRHSELPQTDENRSFFEIRIDVLGDVHIADFKNNFYFYNVKPNDPTGYYTQVGYLDQDNVCRVADANADRLEVIEYVLGDNCPYFSFFNMAEYSADFAEGYSNVAMLIYSSDFVIGGESVDANFVLRNSYKNLSLSLDLGEVSLKKGDSLTVTGILLPWGSQESVYDSDEHAPDQNVRNVREDSLLNPMTPKAIENCDVVESTFVPMVKTTNGKDATFSVKGGQNNVAARVYGFDMLTVPSVYELVDGNWVEYKLASCNTPDQMGYGYKHDGYNVFYDGDGTYSYSFVFAMDEGKERTFKISADKAFEGYGDEAVVEELDLPLNVYITPDNYTKVESSVSGFETVKDGETNVFRFAGNGKAVEKSVIPYKVSSLYDSTGSYIVMKFRIPETNQTKLNFFEFFASTENATPTGAGDMTRLGHSSYGDGKWHVLIVDVSHLAAFKAFDDGTYLAQFFRVDLIDGGGKAIPETDYVDVAYFGMSDSMEDICKLNADMDELLLCQQGAVKKIDPKTGEAVGGEVESETEEDGTVEDNGILNVYVSPEALSQQTKYMAGCSYELAGNGSYIRYYGNGSGEGYITPYLNSTRNRVTGQYIVLKYRIPTDISDSLHNIEIFAGTASSTASGSGDRIHTGAFKQTGEWELMVIDASALAKYTAENGAYSAGFVRLDIFNQKVSSSSYVDIAYFGIADSIEKICEFNSDMETAILVVAGGEYERYNISEPEAWTLSAEKQEAETEGEIVKVEIVEDEVSPAPADPSHFNVYVSAKDLGKIKTSKATYETSKAGQFVRFWGNGGSESITLVYSNASGDKVTGQYVVMKYRVPATNKVSLGNFEVFAGTKATGPIGSGDQKQFGGVVKNGEWQVVVYDVSFLSEFQASDNGTYSAKYLRMDFLNGTCQADTYVDVAYVAMADDLFDICKANSNVETFTLMTKDTTTKISTATGEPIAN